MKIQNFNIGLTDNLKNTYRSSIAEHFTKNHDCIEKFSADFFSIYWESDTLHFI